MFEDYTPFWGRGFRPDTRNEEITPEQLFEQAVEYFKWVDAHPLKEQALFHYKGMVKSHSADKMRPYTRKGLATFLGVTEQTLLNWKAYPHLTEVMEFIEQIIYTQKFEGAAANLLNGNIISRELGLADKREVTGKDGGPLELETNPRDVLADRLAALSANLREDEAASDADT